MKKLLLIIIFIITTCVLYSQVYETSYAAQTGVWSTSKNDWIWNDIEKVTLVITFDDDVVSISNQLNSVFTTIDIVLKQKNYISWKAFDEEFITCYLTMKTTDDYNVLIITYDDVCFKYFY